MEHIGLQFDEKEFELIAMAVLLTSKETYVEWQTDPNNLANQLVAEEYRDLLRKFIPHSGTIRKFFAEVE
jgi:hypothetical protein